MNENLQKLVKQATHNVLGVQQLDSIILAELIVQDCVRVLNKRYMGDQNREDLEVRRCIEDVKKHFGIGS